jgi:hypothetical protein
VIYEKLEDSAGFFAPIGHCLQSLDQIIKIVDGVAEVKLPSLKMQHLA